MAKFKCGDRVRIIERDSDAFGDVATIWKIEKNAEFSGGYPNDTAYCVDIDGHGKFSNLGNEIAFPHYVLEPLVPPDELAWQQFKTFLLPNPSILPPIVTTSDEEAARIAETTPGSHIHVVSRSGNVLSEYWGKPF